MHESRGGAAGSLDTSSAGVPAREIRIEDISFPDDLPIAERREEIACAIAAHQVVIVAGETGSGKTTQLPKICLALGRGREKLIGHTQPRRLAARTVAQRIADELRTGLGDLVGYQVRFTDKVSAATAVKLMTDGILLAEIQRDRLLSAYDTIIIDEAHERSLNIDFLLGYLKRLLPRRPDLKLVITSATIDVDSFSRHFDGAPIIEVSGRTYPVQTHYIEPGETDSEEGSAAQIASIVDAVDAGRFGPRGDMLVFLPGERDIRELARQLRHNPALEVLPLYARLSQAEQNRVFSTTSARGIRVVLATNVAETSLTVPGIRYVIDPGVARISRYSYRTKVQRLPIEPISRASADQRKGRCGRVAAGVCIRLYSEADFMRRPEFTDPEIVRTNLAAVVLQMLVLGLGEVEDFPFINPPDPRMVRDGYKLLEELGAVTPAAELTDLGRRMARLPVDPRLARMVLAAAPLGCLEELLVIASALAVQDPRERPTEKQQQADQAHARFRHPRSDFMAWLNLWRYYEEQRQALSANQLAKLCRREFLSYLRMREWREVHTQLSIACRNQQLRPRPTLAEQENYEGVHKALLAGLLGNIAQLQEGREYLGSRNRKLQIFPGSSQARKPPKWLVAGKLHPAPPFLKHNQRLVRELEELESRTRRRDILVDEEVVFEFYASRLPQDAYTAGRLQGWLKREPAAAAGLRMQREDLLARDPGLNLGEQFPDQLAWEDLRLRLTYQFEPGGATDGVSVTVPVALLNRVPRYRFDWLVPGLLREKCIQLVKGLPKEKRKQLVPVPDHVDRALALLEAGNVDLLQALSLALGRQGGPRLAPEDWAPQKLDDFYRMNVRVVDADGRLLGQGRNLDELVNRFRGDTRQSVSAGRAHSPARSGISRWDFGELPREWRFRQAGLEILSFPALVDESDSVAIVLCDYPGEARLRHRLGVLRLLRLHSAQQVKYLRKQLLQGNEFSLVLAAASLERAALVEDLVDAAYLQAMAVDAAPPYAQNDFLQVLERGRADVITRANELESMLLGSLRVLADIRRLLTALQAGAWPDARRDIDAQLQRLLAAGFMRDTPAPWLAQLPRYLKAVRTRIERLPGQYAKDQAHSVQLQALAAPLWEAAARQPGLLLLSEQAALYRWLLEEFRVSLFAQNLGTRQAVSAKRLQEQWQAVAQWLGKNPR